ncbi:MAG: hypothetical protein COB66_05670 [Coxiella sp. (in: Bacteria)]|nr:MAG: hypothetical protein COB66_05670 [Coxiella sp. (in: g-proteobacteria)]
MLKWSSWQALASLCCLSLSLGCVAADLPAKNASSNAPGKLCFGQFHVHCIYGNTPSELAWNMTAYTVARRLNTVLCVMGRSASPADNCRINAAIRKNLGREAATAQNSVLNCKHRNKLNANAIVKAFYPKASATKDYQQLMTQDDAFLKKIDLFSQKMPGLFRDPQRMSQFIMHLSTAKPVAALVDFNTKGLQLLSNWPKSELAHVQIPMELPLPLPKEKAAVIKYIQKMPISKLTLTLTPYLNFKQLVSFASQLTSPTLSISLVLQPQTGAVTSISKLSNVLNQLYSILHKGDHADSVFFANTHFLRFKLNALSEIPSEMTLVSHFQNLKSLNLWASEGVSRSVPYTKLLMSLIGKLQTHHLKRLMVFTVNANHNTALLLKNSALIKAHRLRFQKVVFSKLDQKTMPVFTLLVTPTSAYGLSKKPQFAEYVILVNNTTLPANAFAKLITMLNAKGAKLPQLTFRNMPIDYFMRVNALTDNALFHLLLHVYQYVPKLGVTLAISNQSQLNQVHAFYSALESQDRGQHHFNLNTTIQLNLHSDLTLQNILNFANNTHLMMQKVKYTKQRSLGFWNYKIEMSKAYFDKHKATIIPELPLNSHYQFTNANEKLVIEGMVSANFSDPILTVSVAHT